MLNALLTKSSHRGLDPSDERVVEYIYSLNEVGSDSDALNVDVDVAGEIPRHPWHGSTDAREVARNPCNGEFDSSDLSSDIGSDIRSTVEQVKTDDYINLEDTDILNTLRCSESTSIATVSHKVREMSQSDNSVHPYTLVNGVTGISNAEINFEAYLRQVLFSSLTS